MIKFKNKNCLFLVLLFSGCFSPSKNEEATKSDESEVCNCLNSIPAESTFDQLMREFTLCVSKFSNGDQERYFQLLDYSIQNCPQFIIELNRAELLESGIDLNSFIPASSSNCNELLSHKRIKNWNANDSTYSLREGDTLYQYENGKINSVWKIINQEGCESIFVVIQEMNSNKLPPHRGDTVWVKTLGIKDSLIKSSFRFKNVELISISKILNE